jgi:putative glutamine amidotransferase
VTRQPLIGVCAAFEPARWSFWEQPAILVPAAYHAAITAAGGVTMPLAPDARVAERPGLVLDVLDGLMLIGGADVDPSRYGADRDPATERTYPLRDDFEIALVRGAVERDLPVLGICRGMQIINVALGGTLVQDLSEPDGSLAHRRRLGRFDGTEHDADVDVGSLAHRATGERRHTIHCHHHQSVGRIGEGLVVSARACGDGVVEAIERPDRAFVLGVQWHPEANERSRVIGELVRAAATTTPYGVQEPAPC